MQNQAKSRSVFETLVCCLAGAAFALMFFYGPHVFRGDRKSASSPRYATAQQR